jgi:hypothetical protein
MVCFELANWISSANVYLWLRAIPERTELSQAGPVPCLALNCLANN